MMHAVGRQTHAAQEARACTHVPTPDKASAPETAMQLPPRLNISYRPLLFNASDQWPTTSGPLQRTIMPAAPPIMAADASVTDSSGNPLWYASFERTSYTQLQLPGTYLSFEPQSCPDSQGIRRMWPGLPGVSLVMVIKLAAHGAAGETILQLTSITQPSEEVRLFRCEH